MPRPLRRALPFLLGAAVAWTAPAEAQSLRGSVSSVLRQNDIAREHDYTFLRTTSDVRRFVDGGYLVPIRGNADYALANVSFPYARPQVRTFLQRLSSQYRAACGEQLVVTSLTRPQSRQPRNASSRSVHPTGMAIDLRVSSRRACRSWLEETLMSLERQGVLDATRERRPPHYHVALFPSQYESYVAQLARTASTRPADDARAARGAASHTRDDTVRYQVRSGDSLWRIARSHGTTVDRLRELNGLETSRIYPGQLIDVPTGR